MVDDMNYAMDSWSDLYVNIYVCRDTRFHTEEIPSGWVTEDLQKVLAMSGRARNIDC